MDQAGETNNIDKAKKLHIVRQTLAKTQTRGPHGEFVKSGIQQNSVQKTENSEQTIVTKTTTASQNKTPSDSKLVSLTEDKTKPTISGDDAPLVDVKVTNPISYLKKWWKKVIGNEGIQLKFSLKVKPLTAFLLIAFVFSGGITISLINRIKDKTPVAQYLPAIGSEPSTERAYTGYLYKNSKGNYYLVSGNEVITLTGEQKIYFNSLVGKKVLANGMYNDGNKTLDVEEIKELTSPDN